MGIGGDEVEVLVFIVDDWFGFGIILDIDDIVMVIVFFCLLFVVWNIFVFDEYVC